MRPRAWVVILVLCVIMLVCRVRLSSGGDSAHAQAKKAPTAATKPAPAPATTVRESWEFKKYGPTAEVAKHLALDEARDRIAEYVGKQNPPLQWHPDVDYIQQNKMVTFSEPKEAVIGQEVTATVEVTNKTFSDMQEQDRKYRAEQRKVVSKDRQALLGKILTEVVAMLAAVAIYLRLDEATKGYYSLWLRLGSVALVATVGAGVWLFL